MQGGQPWQPALVFVIIVCILNGAVLDSVVITTSRSNRTLFTTAAYITRVQKPSKKTKF